MKTIELFRHGQSKQNEKHLYVQGSDPDPSNTLTDLGRRQATAIGRKLNQRGIRPAVVWSSHLPRAKETRDIFLGQMGLSRMPVHEDVRLGEMSKGLRGKPGGLEGRLKSEAYTDEYRRQAKEQGWKFRHGSLESGGETPEEAGRRMLAAMRDIATLLDDGETAFVISHGQSIRYMVGLALGWQVERADTELKLDNCQGVQVGLNGGNRLQLLGRVAC